MASSSLAGRRTRASSCTGSTLYSRPRLPPTVSHWRPSGISGAQPRQLAVTLTAPGLLSPLASGESIAITDGPGRETWTGKRIAVVNAQAGQPADLSPADSASFAPAWSPNGSQIAYVSEPDKGAATAGSDASQLAADRRIWLMGWDGSDQRQLTSDQTYRDERPLWSADGSQVLSRSPRCRPKRLTVARRLGRGHAAACS